jgi:fatty-acyl-CoA synthase
VHGLSLARCLLSASILPTVGDVGTFADHVRARANEDHLGLLFEDDRWTWRELIAQSAARAGLLASLLGDASPPHVGVLLDNSPEFVFWLGATAVSGAVMVGINPTRRGDELASDIRSTDVQVIVTNSEQVGLLDGLDLGAANSRVLVIDGPDFADQLAPFHGSALPTVEVADDDTLFLLFTSGTGGGPAKAVIRSHGRIDFVAQNMAAGFGFTANDIAYMSMPLFHSNALFTAWAPAMASGMTMALRRKFSASAFLSDIRRFGATYFNYVGKPLAYVLATAPQPDDADNPLRLGFGNEGNAADLERFAERFGCPLVDGYGQSETGASIGRVPGMPAGALGMGPPEIKVLDQEGQECPRASFDPDGRLLNAEAATGEIVNTGFTMFEGYYNNPEANAERLRNGWYWTGDLAYRDDAGFFYFAGRSADWVRVDGENFAAGSVEQILARFPGVVLGVAYGVPDVEAGDRLMAALQVDGEFDIVAFASFLAEQPDLGTKWTPTYVRVVNEFPMTSTNKVLKRELVRQRWNTGDPMWHLRRGESYTTFTDADRAALGDQFAAAGRSQFFE